jgi:SnoaL-like domain
MLPAGRRIRIRRPCRARLRDVAADRAFGRATTVVSIDTPSGYKIMGQGVYHYDLVKVDGEWKIRHRRVVNDHLVSDPAKPVNLADPDVAAVVQQLIHTADDLARRGSGG